MARTTVIATSERDTVVDVTKGPEPRDRQSSFAKMERVKREERKRRYLSTSPGERVESALRLSALAVELRSGRRTQRD